MTPSLAAQLIDAQFPELAPARVTYLGEGCDSTAFEVNGHWVFRFPKSKDVERQLDLEAELLPRLAPRVPLAIPVFRFRGEPAASFARRFVGYRKLPGEPAIRVDPADIQVSAIAAPLARFLSALHAFPVDDALSAGVPEEPLDEVITGMQADALGELARVSEVASDAPIDTWRRLFEVGVELPSMNARVALVHNDLAAEHVLFDSSAGEITGVIDWSDVAISHPLVDFTGLFHWGGDVLARAVLDEYDGKLGETDVQCARYLAACRGALDVAFGLDHRRAEYVKAGLRALSLLR